MIRFIDEHKACRSGTLKWGIEPIAKVVGIAPSTYHAAKTRPPSARSIRDAGLKPEVLRVSEQNLSVYGADKVWDQLNTDGVAVARCTVERLMADMRLQGCRRGLSPAGAAEHEPMSSRAMHALQRGGLVRLGALLLATAMTLSACGDDSSDDTAAAATTTAPSAATDTTAATTTPNRSTQPTRSPAATHPTASTVPPPTSTIPPPTHPGPLDPDDPYGPMAVFPGSGGNLASGGTGTVEITDDCVLFHSDGPNVVTVLLVWGDEQAQWVPDQKAIYFDNDVEAPVLLRTGDTIDLAGSPIGVIDPDTGQVIRGTLGEPRPFVWLSEPPATCHQYELWGVSIAKRVP